MVTSEEPLEVKQDDWDYPYTWDRVQKPTSCKWNLYILRKVTGERMLAMSAFIFVTACGIENSWGCVFARQELNPPLFDWEEAAPRFYGGVAFRESLQP